MDVNLLAAAQQQSSNQPRFDQEAYDRAVLRREERRETALKLWVRLRTLGQRIGRFRMFNTGMAASRRLS